MARRAGAVLALEHGALHMARVDGLGQEVLALVGFGMASDAVRVALLGGVTEEDEPVVGGQAHERVLQRVARRASAVVGIQVRDVEAAIVRRHRLHSEPVAIGVAPRLIRLGVGRVLLAVQVEAGQGGDAVHEAPLGGEPASGHLIDVAVAGHRRRRLSSRRLGGAIRLVGRGAGSASPGKTPHPQDAREHRRARNPLARAQPRLRCLLSHISSLGFGK